MPFIRSQRVVTVREVVNHRTGMDPATKRWCAFQDRVPAGVHGVIEATYHLGKAYDVRLDSPNGPLLVICRPEDITPLSTDL